MEDLASVNKKNIYQQGCYVSLLFCGIDTALIEMAPSLDISLKAVPKMGASSCQWIHNLALFIAKLLFRNLLVIWWLASYRGGVKLGVGWMLTIVFTFVLAP